MENSVLMKVNERLQDLVQEALGLLLRQRLVSLLFHVFLQVKLQVFEHKVQLVLRVDNFYESIGKRLLS